MGTNEINLKSDYRDLPESVEVSSKNCSSESDAYLIKILMFVVLQIVGIAMVRILLIINKFLQE